MNRHRCGTWLLALGVVLSCGLVRAQQLPPPPPPAVRTASNLTTDQQKSIDAFIDAQVARFKDENPVAHQQAREALISAVQPQGATVPGPLYLQTFNRSLNRALSGGVPADVSLRGRLNAAIALTRIAEIVSSQANEQLVDAVVRFIRDPDLPVALWGMKAAEEVVPYELRRPLVVDAEDSKILSIIQEVLQKHDHGALYEEAYYATSLKVAAQMQSIDAKAVKIVVPIVQSIFESRVKAMQAEMIEQPHAEMRAMFFLASPPAYAQESKEQKLKTVQLIADFTALLAQRLAENPDSAASLLPVIRYAGSNIAVIGDNENKPALRTAGQQLARIEDNIQPDRVQAMVEGLYSTLKGTFAELQTQPQINSQPAGGEAGNAGTLAAQAHQH